MCDEEMLMMDDHEFSVAGKRTMNDINLYQLIFSPEQLKMCIIALDYLKTTILV